MFLPKGKIAMDSLIGARSRVEGNLLFRGGMRIDGQVVGNVIAESGYESYLVIAEHASVRGQVRCDHLVVNGEITGNVACAILLEIQPKARIIGDVCYKVLEMHGGAQVFGRLSHHENAGAEVLCEVAGA